MSCKSGCDEFERRWCCKCWVTKIPPLWVVICAAILVQIGFGLYPVVVELFAFNSAKKADPYIFSFYRDVAAFPVLLLCTLVAERKLMIPSWRMLLLFAVLGFTGMFAAQLFYISGVKFLGADIASAYQPIMPVWAVLLSMVTCTEKLPRAVHLHSWARFVGILLSVAGAIEVALTGADDESSYITPANGSNSTDPGDRGTGQKFIGYIMVFFNTFLTATYVILQKRFIFKKMDCKWREHPVAVTAYSYGFGALFMAIASLYFVFTGQTDAFYLPPDSIYALVYAIFVTSCLCYLLLTWANLHLSSAIVTAFWPLQVLVTGIAAFLLVGESFAPWQYVGTVALLAGLLMVLFSSYMDDRLSSGKRVIRLDVCCLRCCPKRRMANRRLVNIEDFVSVNRGDDSEASTKLAESEGLLGTSGIGYGAAETGRSHGDKDNKR